MNVLASEGKSREPEKITAENQYACHNHLSMKQVAKVTFSQLKLNPPEHILPTREKNSLEKAAFLNKGYSYIHSFIHSFTQPLN